jgi:hypothetical protein
MNAKKLLVPACLVALGLAAVAVSLATADTSGQPAAGAAPQLPPGWTQEDMMKCMKAGTPGKEHETLGKGVGEWVAKTTMWMTPDSEPIESEGAWTLERFMDGRFFKAEMDGEMPGMGPYHGFGLYGFDNVAGKFVTMWVDNMSTGIMHGDGKLADDGKKLTWTYTGNCPLTEKPTTMREVETIKSADSKTLDMYGEDPKTGKEFHMMHIELTRK